MARYRIRTYGELDGEDASDLAGQIEAQRNRVVDRLAEVERLLVVTSGKGGVGKSLVAAALSVALNGRGRAGLLDADLQGPTAARMLGARAGRLTVREDGVDPPAGVDGVPVISTDLLVDADAPVRWRGPSEESFVWRGAQEAGVFREFLADVAWGELDVLVLDLPPGNDRLEQLADLVGRGTVLAVTIPSYASRSSVERSLLRARDRGFEVAGVVENMSGYACPGCGETRELFPGNAGAELAERLGVELLGRIPFDPRAAAHADAGELDELLEGTSTGAALAGLARRLSERWEVQG